MAKPGLKGLLSAIAGTVLVALCCFTPLLIVVLGTVGLSALTPYLDAVLLPALVIMIIITILAFRNWRRKSG
jgi:mercuric ion transport protein